MSFIWELDYLRQGRNPWLRLKIYHNKQELAQLRRHQKSSKKSQQVTLLTWILLLDAREKWSNLGQRFHGNSLNKPLVFKSPDGF